MSSQWSSRSIGNRFQHNVFYRLIRVAGWQWAYIFLFFVVFWYTCRPSVRARSAAYIRKRFPDSGNAERFLHVWRLQWSFGKTLVDRATMGITGRFAFAVEDKDPLTALADEGRGVILLSAHIGCWQMAPQILAEHMSLPVTVLVYKDAHDVDMQAYEHAGKKPPHSIVGVEEGPAALVPIVNCLRQGQFLCMMGDRLMDGARASVDVDFLGSPISLPCAPYRIASATGAPIVVCFSVRSGPGRGCLLPVDIIRVPGGLGSDPEVYAPYARRYSAALEDFVRRHPYQFFNFFNLWE